MAEKYLLEGEDDFFYPQVFCNRVTNNLKKCLKAYCALKHYITKICLASLRSFCLTELPLAHVQVPGCRQVKEGALTAPTSPAFWHPTPYSSHLQSLESLCTRFKAFVVLDSWKRALAPHAVGSYFSLSFQCWTTGLWLWILFWGLCEQLYSFGYVRLFYLSNTWDRTKRMAGKE